MTQAIVYVKVGYARWVPLKTFDGTIDAMHVDVHAEKLSDIGYETRVETIADDQVAEGQIWRRKSDGTEVEIVRYEARDDDAYWETASTSDPKRKGNIFGYNLRNKYELVVREF